MRSLFFLVLVVAALSWTACAFAPLHSSAAKPLTKRPIIITQLAERRWNFNDGQSPWGVKKNAEVWNGRVAQIAFVIVFLQELIQGKGVLEGLQEGNIVNYVLLGLTVVSVVGLTIFLAIKGDHELEEIDFDSM